MSSPQYSPRKDPFLIATGVRSPKPRAPTSTTSSGGAGRFPKLWFVHASPQGHVRRLQMICIIRLIQRSPQPDVGAQRHAGVELCMRGRLTKMLRLISRNGCGLRALRLRRAAVLGSQSGGSENSRLQVSPFSSSHAGSGKINPSKESGTPPDESCTGVPRSEWGNCSSQSPMAAEAIGVCSLHSRVLCLLARGPWHRRAALQAAEPPCLHLPSRASAMRRELHENTKLRYGIYLVCSRDNTTKVALETGQIARELLNKLHRYRQHIGFGGCASRH